MQNGTWDRTPSGQEKTLQETASFPPSELSLLSSLYQGVRGGSQTSEIAILYLLQLDTL